MAITIESANKALTRNGLGHIELTKHHVSGELAVTSTCEAEPMILGFHDAAGEPITRVRDLTITEVVAQGGRLATMISERVRKDFEIAFHANLDAGIVDEGNIPVTSYSPVTAAEIAATGQQALSRTIEKLQDASVKIVGDVETLTSGFATAAAADYAADAKEYPTFDTVQPDLRQNAAALVALVASGDLPALKPKRTVLVTGAALRGNLIPATGSMDMLPKGNEERRYSIAPRTDNVAHVDNRSKAGVFPQLVGRAVRQVAADTDVTQRNREELQQFAKAQNEAFIAENLTTFDPNAPVFQILRSGDLRVGHSHTLDNRPCHTWKLRDLGMRFMRDKSPAWWVDNAERLALGYLPEDAGPVLTQARVKQHALTLETIRDIANRNGRFAYLIVDDFGKSEAKQSRDLRDAFRRINQGERVFIHSADLKRYDRELKEGKHGDPRGSLDL